MESRKVEIYFDGLCEPVNPGGMACYGFVIYQNGKVIHRGSGVVGEGRGMTNNVAEYTALLKALEWLDRQGIHDGLVIKGDSILVVNQISGNWRIKSQTSKFYVPKIIEMLKGREWRIMWIPRKENSEADSLSREAYQKAIGFSYL